jgi:hypothetical protein
MFMNGKRSLVFGSLGVALAVLALSACQTALVVWDDSLPEEQMAAVRFHNMELDSYNGIGVSKFNYVKIPAGEAQLGGEVKVIRSSIIFTLPGMEWTCHFEAGKEYAVAGAARDMKWGVVVYDTGGSNITTNHREIAFIPFKNQPVF